MTSYTTQATGPTGGVDADDVGPATDRFPTPPETFRDGEDRRVEIRTSGPDDFDELASMYAGFDAQSRAQGIPPADDRRRREWLDTLLDEGTNVAAWHDGAPVGHAVLVPIDDAKAELAIFVAPEYQLAGIGSRLLRTLLGHGRSRGVECVWLTVGRTNRVANNLYQSVGFHTVNGGAEREMELDLSR
ncbi:GNAT family N-acetyltransferase [Halobacterium sp. R2-5]|uniref:GNAT family N-acetyltransferase n=1 Tax=Halobacterium sp. R2-5 TaxID=2715751 RepID=UPI0014205A11|nr:GNAT family N-acetyltransferase [Halobacterium sp. R2-5]NIB99592.1 GNAT family N-acetyltransferase [Halobacterium sp. R2-5]